MMTSGSASFPSIEQSASTVEALSSADGYLFGTGFHDSGETKQMSIDVYQYIRQSYTP